MIFVDTNYFLRFLLRDNPVQHKQVEDLFISASEQKIELITSTIVFFELYWVLESCYKREKQEICKILTNILKLTFIELPERDVLSQSLQLYEKTSLDLEDCFNLYSAISHNAKTFATFDKKLEKEFKTHL